MEKYQKISAVFERNPQTMKVMQNHFACPEFEYLKDNEWIWTEKIDGTNIGVVWDGHSVSFQGRTEKSQIPPKLLEMLESTFGGEDVEEMFEQKFGEKHFILFGEGYGNGIQKCGKAYREDMGFILFDVRYVDEGHPEKSIWLNRESIEDIAGYFHIPAVPVVFTGTIGKAVEFVQGHPESLISPQPMEGLVGVTKFGLCNKQGERIICKVKWRDIRQMEKDESPSGQAN